MNIKENIEKLKQQRFVINYKRMWPYVKPIWFRALLSLLICIPIGSLDAIIALALKPYMDLVMVEKSIASPWYIPIGIVAFTSMQGGLKYLSSYLSTWVGCKISNALKFDLFKKLLTYETAFYDKRNSGDVIFQFNNIAYGSHLIMSGAITAGNFVSFITALILLYTPVKSIGNNLNSVQFSFYAIEQVFEKLDGQPAIKDKENAIPMNREHSKIEFKDVNFEYVENVPVLKNINLEINKGETIAFVGNSGGGKTTIVNLLPRFYDIKSGSITVDGTDIRDFTLYSLRQNIAVVFQDNFLFSGTIRENIMLGNPNATEENLQKAVKMAFLDEFIATLQDGLDTVIGERGVLLSGGQKQRVAIARAFLKDAPIIILDEATSALDNKAEAIVQKAIDNLMQDKTVFVIAHRLSTIQNANKIVVINQGEIVETGTHEELLNIENGAYKTLYEMQFKKQEVSL